MHHSEAHRSTITVLQVLGTLDRGGTEKRTIDLMKAMDRNQFRQEFCVLSGNVGALDADVRSLGGEIHYCRLEPGFSRRFIRLLRDRHIDVVHSHVHNASGFVLRLAARTNTPVRIAHFRSTHNGRPDSLRRSLQERLMKRWIMKYATHVLGVSEAALTFNWGTQWREDSRFQIVRNGIDPRQFRLPDSKTVIRHRLGLPSKATVFINVGSFQQDKNHIRLLEIFSEVRLLRPDSILVLVGGRGSEQDRVADRVDSLGLERSVIMTGERDDVPAWLRASDVFVFPSRREGSPGALLEAVAAGLPVVASDIPPIVEISRISPGVRVIPLNSGNRIWVEAILAAGDEVGLQPDLETLDRFWNAFDVANTAEAHQIIWSGGQAHPPS